VVFERADTVEFGTEDAGFGARVSGLERALLDAAARPDLVGGYFPLAEALAASDADPARLQDLAEDLGAGPALRRVGSLADGLELAGLAGELKPLTQLDWDLDLDPELRESSGAFRDGSWRIRWPVDPRAVAEEIAQ
jgi:predicted transcriptional regulator of viral defense system